VSAAPPDPAKPRRGGARPGAGRKKKDRASPSAVTGLDLQSALAAAPPTEIDAVAQRHARSAIDGLVKQLIHGRSEHARINAANTILDRGYGKPSVDTGGDQFLPFLGTAPQRALASEIRDEARKFAHLAVEVLNKIAGNGESETARVSAQKSLLERGLGTVATAKMPEQGFRRQLGKKEEATAAAREVGIGRYATPPPPRATMQ
jgi:hypothetical protein